MSVGDWSGIVSNVALIYFAWKQNQIFKTQNDIFAVQAGKKIVTSSGRIKFYWPLAAMFVFVLLNAAVTGYDYYDRHNAENLAEFDAPTQNGELLVHAWGQDSPSSCFMEVSGRALASRGKEFKAAIGCFIYDGTMDILDAPYVQVSNLYDINSTNIMMRVTYGEFFNRYLTEKHAIGIEVALLNVPNGVAVTQFSTLRQARALGVRIVDMRIAKRGA